MIVISLEMSDEPDIVLTQYLAYFLKYAPKSFHGSLDGFGNAGHDRFPSAQRCSFDAEEGPAFSP